MISNMLNWAKLRCTKTLLSILCIHITYSRKFISIQTYAGLQLYGLCCLMQNLLLFETFSASRKTAEKPLYIAIICNMQSACIPLIARHILQCAIEWNYILKKTWYTLHMLHFILHFFCLKRMSDAYHIQTNKQMTHVFKWIDYIFWLHRIYFEQKLIIFFIRIPSSNVTHAYWSVSWI